MTVTHLKKKDVVKSKVRGVDLEFDHEKLATILGVPGKNGICEYIKEVWEESKYTKPLEITRRFANDETIMKARRVKSVEMKPSQRENGIWWIGSEENRRRDDDEEAPEEEAEDENEENQDDFDWEAVIDEATVEGESGSDDQFYDAQVEVEEPMMKHQQRPDSSSFIFNSTERSRTFGVDPRVLLAEKSNFEISSEFERKRANRFHDKSEKAKVENAKLLALLHQAQTKPHP
ncbi:hypothetical protein Dimus_003054 [Dionaea muscipula]